jgi:hypothetical protein
MLLPLFAAADSELGAAHVSLRAAARVNFKVVIPPVLSLDMPGGAQSGRDARSVAIFSNNHNVTLAATLRSSGEARATVLLSSGARKILAQKVVCMPDSSRAAALPPIARRSGDSTVAGVVCTASMP